jgi:hypothetical protein
MKTRIELDFKNRTVKSTDIPDGEPPVGGAAPGSAVLALANDWEEQAKVLQAQSAIAKDDVTRQALSSKADVLWFCAGKVRVAMMEENIVLQAAHYDARNTIKLVDAPATCNKCGSRYVSPTTGKVLNKCHCGGALIPPNAESSHAAGERKHD